MTLEIRVAKTTKNALTSTDPNDFIFHSSYNTFKILAEGILTSQTVNANPKTFSVAHGLSYVPNFHAFCKFPSGRVALPQEVNDGGLGLSPDTVLGRFDVEADDTNVYFILTKLGSNYDVDIKWYVFEVAL